MIDNIKVQECKNYLKDLKIRLDKNYLKQIESRKMINEILIQAMKLDIAGNLKGGNSTKVQIEEILNKKGKTFRLRKVIEDNLIPILETTIIELERRYMEESSEDINNINRNQNIISLDVLECMIAEKKIQVVEQKNKYLFIKDKKKIKLQRDYLIVVAQFIDKLINSKVPETEGRVVEGVLVELQDIKKYEDVKEVAEQEEIAIDRAYKVILENLINLETLLR